MKKIIIGNLKLNLVNSAERENYFNSFNSEIKKNELLNSEIVLCPPFIHLEKFVEKISRNGIMVGVQNIFIEDRGSFTGEISPLMVKNFGGRFVIIGHSERRKYFGETNETCNEKIKAVLKNNLKPIYCVGESEKEKKEDRTFEIIEKQIKEGLLDIPSTKVGEIVIAYEPIWAVGTDSVPESNEIMKIKILIRKILAQMCSSELAEKIPILYGGSVKPKTAFQLCVNPGMDGALVGRESLIPAEFLKIAKIIDEN